MDESGQSEEQTLRVEGRGCVFGRQVVFGYHSETEAQVQFRVSTKSGELQIAVQQVAQQTNPGSRTKAEAPPHKRGRGTDKVPVVGIVGR